MKTVWPLITLIALIFIECSSSQKRGLSSEPNSLSYLFLEPVEKKLTLGMTLEDLRNIWGEPKEVLISGRSQDKNQK